MSLTIFRSASTASSNGVAMLFLYVNLWGVCQIRKPRFVNIVNPDAVAGLRCEQFSLFSNHVEKASVITSEHASAEWELHFNMSSVH
jgi:hypothetical protein